MSDGCTCAVTGPGYDDTTFDPACPFHGDDGSMVMHLAFPGFDGEPAAEPEPTALDIETDRWRLLAGDCVEVLAGLDAASVDSVVCDPPYGLEFMGRDWDKFRLDDPGTNRHRGEYVGNQGGVGAGDGSYPARSSRAAVSLGGGKRPNTNRCTGCGKRDQFRNPHACSPNARWVLEPIDPFAAPPTMLAFQNWTRLWAMEVLRVLKPGGHLLAFGGTRTYHRLASGLEDAGFEIRDCVAWMHGQGFPKSMNVGKRMDDAAGVEREVVGQRTDGRYAYEFSDDAKNAMGQTAAELRTGSPGFSGAMGQITLPATPEAEQWDGWGTALKPAFEPVVLARKPLTGTVTANVLEHGVGALNIDACRIEFAGDGDEAESKEKNRHADFDTEPGGNKVYGDYSMVASHNYDAPGRWPPNVALDPEAAAALDEQSGDAGGGFGTRGRGGQVYANGEGFANSLAVTGQTVGFGDSGGASRFFYTAKTSSAERNAGLEGFAVAETHRYGAGIGGSEDSRHVGAPDSNIHPTVKPIELMRWLVRLVTPPDGLVLDPFTGSGSTGIAAVLEGFRFLGVEQQTEYLAIAEARIRWWERHGGEGATSLVLASAVERAALEAMGQESLF